MKTPGKRVGAILSASNGVCKFLGYGTYVGNEIPPKNIGGFNLGWPNPKIILDSGKEIYGCECWWASEARIQKELAEYDQVIQVDIDAVRQTCSLYNNGS